VRRGSRHNLSRDEYLGGMAYAYARRGTDLPHAKLTPEIVRTLRSDTRPAREWAERLGVHVNTVWRARSRENWGHV
jgi:hypothetical protein